MVSTVVKRMKKEMVILNIIKRFEWMMRFMPKEAGAFQLDFKEKISLNPDEEKDQLKDKEKRKKGEPTMNDLFEQGVEFSEVKHQS